MLNAIVFVTGAAILALELLASRIMTPYFGVSLFIWTGILSITLIALALGYWFGGRLAVRDGRARPVDELTTIYAWMPAVAALAIVIACVVYPFVFLPLARLDLIVGAFAACVILLFVPLFTTSTMSPLLVAIRGASAPAAGDAGAGRVFFISTLGSVVGVSATAFGLIPHCSNFTATLIVALALAVQTLLVALGSRHPVRHRRRVIALGMIALLAAAMLLIGKSMFVGLYWPARYSGREWQREAAYHSLFGTVQILKSAPDADGSYRRMYFQDGITQNTVASDGQSLSMYTWMLDALIRSYQPNARRVLALGLGAGIVPRMLAARGLDVTVVEIDPASIRAARETFALPAETRIVREDARTFLQSCDAPYDVVVVDLLAGDGVPEYLVTREFFEALRSCVSAHGIAVLNTFADRQFRRPHAHLIATLQSAMPDLVFYQTNYKGVVHVNNFVVAAAARLPEATVVTVDDAPQSVAQALSDMLKHPQAFDASLLKQARVITDASNPVALDIAKGQARHREAVIEAVPEAFLFD